MDSHYVNRIMRVLFQAGQPLTQEEILARIHDRYKKKCKAKVLQRYIDGAVEIELLVMKSSDQEITYYPTVSQEEYNRKQKERLQQLAQEGAFSDYVASHIVPEEMSEERYERIKKLIDELE